MINDFGAGAPDVIGPHVVQDIAFLVAVATRATRDHARRGFAFVLGLRARGRAGRACRRSRRRRRRWEQVHSIARNE